jgi:WD40 repeat protein
MEERVAALEKAIKDLLSENSSLKQDISYLKDKISSIEKKNEEYVSRVAKLEKQGENSKIQNKLTNAPKLDIKHDHKEWITTLVIMNGRCLITGSKGCSIKCLQMGEDEQPILFTIEKAHEREVQYIMKVDKDEIISCGDDGQIKRWHVDCGYSWEKKDRYKLIETFSINGSTKVHEYAYKIIKLKNGDLCSCGKGSSIKFWKRNNVLSKHENYQTLKCEADYVQSVMELDDNKLVAGGWHHTQFFDIKEFKAETDIKNTFTEHANAMIRMGDKIICSGWGIFFIDIKTQQLISTIQIEFECEEGIYCLARLTDNLIICGGNLRTIDIYDVNTCEKVASRAVEDEFIFDVKSDHDGYFFCGSKNIFGYILNELKDKKEENEGEEEEDEL